MKQSKKYDLRDLEFEDEQTEETANPPKFGSDDSEIEDELIRTKKNKKGRSFVKFFKRKEVIMGLGAGFILVLSFGVIINNILGTHPKKQEIHIAQVQANKKTPSDATKTEKTKNINTSDNKQRPSAFPVGGKEVSSSSVPSNSSTNNPVVQSTPSSSTQDLQTTTIENNSSGVSNSSSGTSETLQLTTTPNDNSANTPPVISYLRIDLIPYIGEQIGEVTQYLTEQGATVIVQYQIDKTHPSGTILEVTTQNNTTAVFTVSQ